MRRLTWRDKEGNAHTKRETSYFAILEKLAKYEELEEQGLLLKLPCKAGTLVYEAWKSDRLVTMCGIDEHRMTLEDVSRMGKTVFLTREEAEAKLKELENANV